MRGRGGEGVRGEGVRGEGVRGRGCEGGGCEGERVVNALASEVFGTCCVYHCHMTIT